MKQYDIFLLILIYIVVGCFIFGALLKKSKTFAPAYKGFVFGMLFYYVVIPVIVLLNMEDFNLLELNKGKYCTYSVLRFVINGKLWKKLYAILMLIISFTMYNLTYNGLKIKPIKKQNYEKTINIVRIIGYVSFFLGMISLILTFVSFGGIKNALSYAERLRTFNSSILENNQNINGMLILLSKLITVAPFMFIYLNQKENKKIYKILFMISFVMSIIYFLFNAGKAPLLLFIISFAYLIFYNRAKHPWVLIVLCSVICLPIIDILDSLFSFFQTGVLNLNNLNYISQLSQFTFPYKNNLILTDLTHIYGLKFGTDLIFPFLDLLPGIGFDASYVNTSEFIVGLNWRELGGIPNDFLTFSYLQFSFVGVIIFSVLLGYLTKLMDRKLSNFVSDKGKVLFSASITVDFFAFVAYADLISILKGKFIFVALIIIIMLSSRKEEKI